MPSAAAAAAAELVDEDGDADDRSTNESVFWRRRVRDYRCNKRLLRVANQIQDFSRKDECRTFALFLSQSGTVPLGKFPPPLSVIWGASPSNCSYALPCCSVFGLTDNIANDKSVFEYSTGYCTIKVGRGTSEGSISGEYNVQWGKCPDPGNLYAFLQAHCAVELAEVRP